jgi:LysR family transcriptional regulator, transcriptional activator of the cysJI operon
MLHHELEKFLYIIDLGGFNTAAKQKHISQPALSSAIKSLEKSFGTQLIVRNKRPLKLTPAGNLLYELATEHKSNYSLFKQRVERLKQTEQSTRIGSIDSIGHRIMSSNSLPEPIEIYIDNSNRLVKMVSNDLIDICFITKPTDKLEDYLESVDITNESFTVVANHTLISNDSPLIKGGEINLATYNPESNTYKLIMSYLDNLNVNYRIKFTSTNPFLILEYIKRNPAIALLPTSTIVDELNNHQITQINMPKFYRPVQMIMRKGFKLNPKHQEIVQQITSVDQEQDTVMTSQTSSPR